MDSPLAPKPVLPSLMPHRIDQASRDRKRKGRSFEDELAEERDDADGEHPAPRRVPPAPPQPRTRDSAAPPASQAGHLIDLEA